MRILYLILLVLFSVSIITSRVMGEEVTPAPVVPEATPAPPSGPPQGYEVLPQRPSTRGQFWLSDGPQLVLGEGTYGGNRFDLGGEFQFGDDYRFDVGLTFLDLISSSETSSSVGDVSRIGFGLNLAYYIIPDRLWIRYMLDFQSVSGSRVSGSVTTYGQQASIGYQFTHKPQFNWALEATYLYAPSVTVSVFDVTLNAQTEATYPKAQVWGLNLRLNFDVGGY